MITLLCAFNVKTYVAAAPLPQVQPTRNRPPPPPPPIGTWVYADCAVNGSARVPYMDQENSPDPKVHQFTLNSSGPVSLDWSFPRLDVQLLGGDEKGNPTLRAEGIALHHLSGYLSGANATTQQLKINYLLITADETAFSDVPSIDNKPANDLSTYVNNNHGEDNVVFSAVFDLEKVSDVSYSISATCSGNQEAKNDPTHMGCTTSVGYIIMSNNGTVLDGKAVVNTDLNEDIATDKVLKAVPKGRYILLVAASARGRATCTFNPPPSTGFKSVTQHGVATCYIEKFEVK